MMLESCDTEEDLLFWGFCISLGMSRVWSCGLVCLPSVCGL